MFAILRSLKDEASYEFWCYIYWLHRKAGHGPDGWMVGPEVDHNTFMVTTRNKVEQLCKLINSYRPSRWQGYCPNEVMGGFDRDSEEDSSLRLECTVPLADLQDPGVPTSPLNDAQANRWFWLSYVMCISAKQMKRFLVNHREELWWSDLKFVKIFTRPNFRV